MVEKSETKKDTCSHCGRRIRRNLMKFDPACESAGRYWTCPVCRGRYWVPGDPNQPVIPAGESDKLIRAFAKRLFGDAEKAMNFANGRRQ